MYEIRQWFLIISPEFGQLWLLWKFVASKLYSDFEAVGSDIIVILHASSNRRPRCSVADSICKPSQCSRAVHLRVGQVHLGMGLWIAFSNGSKKDSEKVTDKEDRHIEHNDIKKGMQPCNCLMVYVDYNSKFTTNPLSPKIILILKNNGESPLKWISIFETCLRHLWSQ